MSTGPIHETSLVFALDDTPSLLSAKGHTLEILGLTEKDLLAPATLADRIHPGDADIAARLFAPGLAPNLAQGSACLRVRHADGRIRCLHAQFRKVRKDGLIRLKLSLRSVGELWTSPAEAQPPHFQSMIENTGEPVFFKDTNHVFVAASRSFAPEVAKVLGGRELLGLTDYDFLPEHDADQYYAAEKRALSDGIPVEDILQLTRPDEGTFLMYVHHRPVRSASGEVIGLFTIARNLTDRVRQEEPPEETVQKTEVGTFILDLRRGAAAISESLDLILGFDENDPRDIANWQKIIHPDDHSATVEYFTSVIAIPGRIFKREYRIVRPTDGAVRWIHGLGRVYRDAEGQPLLMRGTLEDITERKAMEAALRQTKKRLELFIEHAPAALAMYDRDMKYLAISRRWREMYSVTGDIIGQSHYEVVPDIPEHWKEIHRRGLAGESLRSAEDRFDRADGSTIWIRWEMMPWRYDDDTVGGILLFAEDISEPKRAQQRLELAASVFADASEAIFVTGVTGEILEVNESFTRITGYSREEVVGRHSHLLKSDHHDEEFYNELARSVVETGRWRGEQWFRRKDGSSIEVSTTITTVFDTAGNPAHYVGLFFDITSIKEQERRLQQATHYDELTGLPNRAFASERLRSALVAAGQSRQTVGLVFFDLDDFKRINEAHGRDAADSLLVTVASRMKQVLREGDTLGRIGGDEFLAVLPNLSDTDAAAGVVERLFSSISQTFSLGETELRLSATAGATFYPQAEEVDADQMIRQAVQAMYEAKLAGKNRYQIFNPARDYNLRGRHEEMERIRHALRADEMVLHYQPKINMASGALIGAEALIRWQHPQHGLLLPNHFLPAVEQDDLAVEVGEWVIKTALHQIESWANAGYRIPVSVNICPRFLQQGDFVERLSALLLEHPTVDPSCLELEILETSAVQDFSHVSDIIEACLAIGIQVAIDDFGTGYSSLSYLKRLPAPVLKIDQSFVRNMLDDPDDLALLQGIMGLAKAFRRTVIAEGVETVEQGVRLLELGCTFAQGYGIARPMPASELVSWYSNWWPHPSWTRAQAAGAQEWPVLLAQVEVRAWGRTLERYMAGTHNTYPELDERRCRFGVWIDAEKAGARAASPLLRQIEALHRRAHVAGRKAVDLKQRGFLNEAMSLARGAIALGEQIEAKLASLATPSDTDNGHQVPQRPTLTALV